MLRCKSEAIKLTQRVETLKNKITAHENSLFTKTTGKLQTGLTCRHKFNADTLHFITTGIEGNIDNFVQDMERVMKNLQNLGREKKAVPKQKGARFMLQRLERREPVSYFCLWEAHQLTRSMIH